MKKADPELLKEIRKLTTTKAERLTFLAACDDFSRRLGGAIKANNGAQALKDIFDNAGRGYPRAVIACSLAATIVMREELSRSFQVWAHEILEAWNPTGSQRLRAYIDDNLNQTRIAEYAGSFIRCTSIT